MAAASDDDLASNAGTGCKLGLLPSVRSASRASAGTTPELGNTARQHDERKVSEWMHLLSALSLHGEELIAFERVVVRGGVFHLQCRPPPHRLRVGRELVARRLVGVTAHSIHPKP